MAENLNEIWAKSRSLSEHFLDVLNNVDIQKSILENYQSPEIENTSNFAMTLDSINKSMAASIYRKQRHTEASERLRNQLVAAEIALIGVREYVDAFKIERIQPDFWIGANISPETNDAHLGPIRFSKLRIVSTSITERESAEFSLRGQEILRLEAVRECEKLGIVDLSGGPKSRRSGSNNILIRTDIYLDYLKHKYPDMDFEVWGYSESSFERTESIHKKKKL
tara:strand:+ start:5938 stop:6609 length:672 start_codon:yes stop_codon:yes gene_type:complete